MQAHVDESMTEGAAAAAAPDAPAHEKPTSLFPPVVVPESEWPRLTFSLALLAATGSSVALLAASLALPPADLVSLLTKNTLAPVSRAGLLLPVLVGGISPVLVAVLGLLRARQSAIPVIERVASLLSPLSLSCFVPILFASSVWWKSPLPYLIGLVLFTIGLEQTLERAFRAVPDYFQRAARDAADAFSPRTRTAVPWAILFVAVAGYSVFVSYFTLMNHWRLGTAAFDLGINVNWMYNAMHGHPMRTPVLFGPVGGNMIAGHAIYAALFLWLPFYALRPGPEPLLIYQAVIVALAAIPLYKFAKTQLPRTSALLVALAYLCFAPLHGANFYDFHELLPAIVFHFSLYYGIATRKNWIIFVAVPVLFLIREDISIGTSVLGMFLLMTGIRPRLGAVLSVVSVVWFVIDKFVIMPWVGSWWFANIYIELMPEGEKGYGGIVKTILINPAYFFQTLLREQKLIYFLHMFAPLAFLPARRFPLLLVASPGFFFTLMTTNYGPTVSIAFQYTTHWVPYLFGASVLALRWLGHTHGPARRRAALGAMIFAMASHSFVFGAFARSPHFQGGFSHIQFHMTPAEIARYQDVKALAAMIPRDASCASTEELNPHASVRLDSYTLRLYHGDAEYLFMNAEHGLGGPNGVIGQAFAKHPYGLVAQRGQLYLFKKNHVSPDSNAARAKIGLSEGKPSP